MLDRIDFSVTAFERSRAFYVPALAPLGINPVFEIKRDDGREGTGFGRGPSPQFWIGRGPAVSGRLHVAFATESRAAVDAFYKAALEAGEPARVHPA